MDFFALEPGLKVTMRGMAHIDPIESSRLRHQEGNEGEKNGVKLQFGAFYGAKLLKRWVVRLII